MPCRLPLRIRFAVGFVIRAGWRKAKTKEGETLYVNDIEKITSWDPPVAIAPPATVPQHGSEGRVDHGKNHGAPIVWGSQGVQDSIPGEVVSLAASQRRNVLEISRCFIVF